MIHYVSTQGSDLNNGDIQNPFRTISKAATVAVAGDVIRVRGGIYRERVAPQNSGMNDECRIVYEAFENEKPIIKGSELIRGWEWLEDKVWKVVLPNSLFGDFNPFAVGYLWSLKLTGRS